MLRVRAISARWRSKADRCTRGQCRELIGAGRGRQRAGPNPHDRAVPTLQIWIDLRPGLLPMTCSAAVLVIEPVTVATGVRLVVCAEALKMLAAINPASPTRPQRRLQVEGMYCRMAA